MQAIIDVFRMNELPTDVRADIIISLGRAINHENGMNITEGIVYHLVKVLQPENPILKDEFYIKKAGVNNSL